MGCENNYRVKILSKHFYIFNNYTTNKSNRSSPINPWFWTGLTDAEGSFKIGMSKTNKRKLGWRIEPNFEMTLHIRDYDILVQFQLFLGGIGNVYISKKKDIVTFIVSSKKDLENLITHIDNFPLLSQKLLIF